MILVEQPVGRDPFGFKIRNEANQFQGENEMLCLQNFACQRNFILK